MRADVITHIRIHIVNTHNVAPALTFRLVVAISCTQSGRLIRSGPLALAPRLLRSLRRHVLFDIEQLVHVEQVVDIVDGAELVAGGELRV